jgi:hypothetical protein
MMRTKFWVIGAEYTCPRFERIVEGTQRMVGPFPAMDEALAAWRRLADETRSNCLARFTVVQEAGVGR